MLCVVNRGALRCPRRTPSRHVGPALESARMAASCPSRPQPLAANDSARPCRPPKNVVDAVRVVASGGCWRPVQRASINARRSTPHAAPPPSHSAIAHTARQMPPPAPRPKQTCARPRQYDPAACLPRMRVGEVSCEPTACHGGLTGCTESAVRNEGLCRVAAVCAAPESSRRHTRITPTSPKLLSALLETCRS